MVIDLGMQGGFIDGVGSADSFMLQQTDMMQYLTQAGKAAWETTKSLYQDVVGGVTRMLGVKQYLLNQGTQTSDTQVYAISTGENLLSAGLLMRSYIMSHPEYIKLYKQGIDIYEGQDLPEDSSVIYHRAISGIVQEEGDDVRITYHIDDGYDDLHQPTHQDKVNLAHTYRYFSQHVINNVGKLS